MLQIGIQLSSLRLPLKKALPCAASLGATGVVIDARGELKPAEMTQTGLRQVRKWLDDYGLRVAAVRFQTRRGFDCPDDLQRRIDATKQAMQMARALGCDTIINQIGQIPEPEDDPGAWTRLVESLADLGRCSQHIGTWLAATTGTEPGVNMRRLLQHVPADSFRVNFDPGLLIVHGFSAVETLCELAPFVAHVHARDGVRDLARGRGLEVPLGRGIADFPQIVGTLAEQAYHGFWTIAREHIDDPVGEISRSVSFLKSI